MVAKGVDTGVAGYCAEPAGKRQLMSSAKILELEIHLGETDLNDLFDLFRSPKISGSDRRDQPLMTIENFLECAFIAGENKLGQCPIRPGEMVAYVVSRRMRGRHQSLFLPCSGNAHFGFFEES